MVEDEGRRAKEVKGRVLSVNISQEKGTKKRNVGISLVRKDMGLEGDAHAGVKGRHVSLLLKESIERMRQKGITVEYGDFAENITIDGLHPSCLFPGTKLRVGKDVVLSITRIGKECHKGCAIFKAVGDCIMPKEGIFAVVEKGGTVQVGDEVEIL